MMQHGWVSIKLRQAVKQGRLIITDMCGRMLVMHDLYSQIPDYNLDISQLERGPHLIRIISNEINLSQKLLVE